MRKYPLDIIKSSVHKYIRRNNKDMFMRSILELYLICNENKDEKEYSFSKSDLFEELKELYNSNYCVVYNKDEATHYVKYKDNVEENEVYIIIETIINYDE